MMLLSGAWWAQKLTGIIPQALGIAVFLTATIGLVTGGLAWLRHDARMDERNVAAGKIASARLQEVAKLRLRERTSEAIGADQAAKFAVQLAASEGARMTLEVQLAAMKRNPVCWPKALVGDLNK